MTSDRSLELLLGLGDPTERRSRAELVEHALRAALTVMDADAVASLTHGTRRSERLILHSGSQVPAAVPPPPEGSEVLRRFAEALEPLAVGDLSDDPPLASDACPGVDSGPVSFTPLRQRGLAPGYLAVYRRRGRARFGMADMRLMVLLAAWLGAALESLRLATGTARLAVHDENTDVYNARYLKTALKREVRRASRYGQELSLLVIEVDRVPAGGRPAALLREVASVLAQQVRSFDLLGRHARDTFMAILPQTGREGALEVAERMRAAVERQGVAGTAGAPVTISLGASSFPKDALALDELVAAAERALLQARQRGRNQVVPASQAA